MDESQSPLPDEHPPAALPDPGRPIEVDPPVPADGPVEVAVKRSGGFAGLTRQWRAEPPPAEAPEWIDLITRCPWDAAPAVPAEVRAPVGADRFVWRIRARCGEEVEREAELPDDEVVGAWRELVDAVRAWSRAAAN